MKLIGLSLFLITTAASAALPPYWERSREMVDILRNPGIQSVVEDSKYSTWSSQMIDSVALVTPTDTGVEYKITSGKCELPVYLTYKSSPPGVAGPFSYDIAWKEQMVCTP